MSEEVASSQECALIDEKQLINKINKRVLIQNKHI